jgi:hypothetical protein
MADVQTSAEPVQIFISYSHHDRSALLQPPDDQPTELLRRILDLEKKGAKVIMDKSLVAGDYFDDTIRSWLDQANILLALVSEDFLQSDYCTQKEVASMLKRRRRKPLARIVPFYLHPCDWRQVEWLRQIEGLPSPDRPLSDIQGEADRKREFNKLRTHLQRNIDMIVEDR